MRRRLFSEALDALKQAEAREKLELEDHKRRVRGENVGSTRSSGRRGTGSLCSRASAARRRRDQRRARGRGETRGEARFQGLRATRGCVAHARVFRDPTTATRTRTSGADGDAAFAAARETAHLVSKNVTRVPSMRRRRAVTRNAGSQVASRIGETSLADTRDGRCGDGDGETELRETKLRDGDDAATPPLAIKKKHAERMEHTEQRIASANASPAAVLDFYSDVGGVADVMRLDVNPTTGARAPEPVAFRDASSPPGPGSVLNASHHFVSKNRAPSRSEAVTRSPSSVPLNAEADRGHNDNHDSHDSHDSHDASLATNDDRSQSAGVRNETFTRTSEQCHTNASAFLRVAPTRARTRSARTPTTPRMGSW